VGRGATGDKIRRNGREAWERTHSARLTDLKAGKAGGRGEKSVAGAFVFFRRELWNHARMNLFIDAISVSGR
jgi:hypothetical protein